MLELLRLPHVADYFKALGVVDQRVHALRVVLLVDSGVGQVGIFVVQMVRIVVVRGEPQVRLKPEPNLEFWPPGGNDNPLPNIELTLLNDEWRLDVLLGHPDLVHRRADVLDETVLVAVDLNASTSRLATWLHDPSILLSIETKLMLSHGSL